MRKINALIAAAAGLLVPVLMLAQEPTTTSPIDPMTGNMSDTVVALFVSIFASAGSWYKIIDGMKNLIPWVRDNPKVLKILNFAGNFLTLGAACFVMGQVHNVFDAAKCLFLAVAASLMSAGFYEGKRVSDLARASAGVAAFTKVEEKRAEEDKK